MTDLNNLSYKELKQLENLIKKYKQGLCDSKDCLEGYKITFCVKFNPAKHEDDELNSPEEFVEPRDFEDMINDQSTN